MKAYLCITIDVEPDCSPTWLYSTPLAFTAVSSGIAKLLHPFFRQFEIRPTYLINNVVLEDDESISVFKSLDGQFELGTHLHAEFIEPNKLYTDYAGKEGTMRQCFLEPQIEYNKLKTITNLFTSRLGYAPVSFRAGRFSAGKNTIWSLKELGYKVDTSVTPKIVWKDPDTRSIDFASMPDQPYWTDENSFPGPSNNGTGLLQVPVSIVTEKRFGLFKRPLWLRPYYSDAAGMVKVASKIIRENHDNSVVVLNMMFHNVEVMPGLNPYTKSQREIDAYIDSMKTLFDFCLKTGIQPGTLSDIYNSYCH